jgi:hypothetical protein
MNWRWLFDSEPPASGHLHNDPSSALPASPSSLLSAYNHLDLSSDSLNVHSSSFTHPFAHAFDALVREFVVGLLLLLLTCGAAYALLRSLRPRRDELLAGSDEDALVYRVTVCLCTFALAMAIGSGLILPFSMVSNEVLLAWPACEYVQWLNQSLVQRLWDGVFFFSHLSLFALLPFAYFFSESTGFSGSGRGIASRVAESAVLLALILLLLIGGAYLFCASLGLPHLVHLPGLLLLWRVLPLLCTGTSLLGALLLLFCAPFGVAALFAHLSQLLVPPNLLSDSSAEYERIVLDEASLRRQLLRLETYLDKRSPILGSPVDSGQVQETRARLQQVQTRRIELDHQRKAGPFRRNLLCPLALLTLLALAVLSLMQVAKHTLELSVGVRALPSASASFVIGLSPLSQLGLTGSMLQLLLLMYLWATGVVGMYSLPLVGRLRPQVRNITLAQLVANCALHVLLASALPVVCRTLGITEFELLGHFARLEWLHSFALVFGFNIAFLASISAAIGTHFTRPLRRELFKRLRHVFRFCAYKRVPTTSSVASPSKRSSAASSSTATLIVSSSASSSSTGHNSSACTKLD